MMYRKIAKRFFDIILSLFLIVAISPVWIIICMILLLTGEHSVFYVQKRVGLNSKPFKIWKHNTMLKGAENMHGGLYTTRNDPRILPFGRFLRKTKLDELPQLFQILNGKMSFIGPRPLVVNNPYPKHIQDEIYKIKPGVTGLGSIIFRDEERLLSEAKSSPEEFYANYILPYKASLELWYQENYCFWVDAKLAFCTIYAIFIPDTSLPFQIFRNLPPIPHELDLAIAI